MTPAAAGAPWGLDVPIGDIRRRKREATQRLLGDTISISELAWQQPSRLPAWSRAHVATHLARNADALRRVVHGLLSHSPAAMYPDEHERWRAIERGSERRALDLQIDLDISAGQLNETLDYLEDSGEASPVRLSQRLVLPATMVPLVRLSEVVLHHIDLDLGYGIADLDDDVANWLLPFWLHRLNLIDPAFALRLRPTNGPEVSVGDPSAPVVEGSAADLLGWVTGRADARRLSGADGLILPARF